MKAQEFVVPGKVQENSKELLERFKDYEWRKSVERIADFQALFKYDNTIEVPIHGFPKVKYRLIADGQNCMYQKYYLTGGKFVMGTGATDKVVFAFTEEHLHEICALYESVIKNLSKLTEEETEEFNYFKGEQLSLF